MPLYEYQCARCGKRFELIQKFSDPSAVTCVACGDTAHRLLSAASFQFKGSGWYVTDYARKPDPGKPDPGKPDSGKPAPGESSAEKSESKAADESGKRKEESKPAASRD